MATCVLLMIVAGVAYVQYRQIIKASANTQIEEIKDNQLGTLCGEITGAGIIIVWVVAYRRRSKLP